jgi:hypothetical protein
MGKTEMEIAASEGDLPKLKRMLEACTANLAELKAILWYSAANCRYAMVEWLLTDFVRGANVTEKFGDQLSLWYYMLCGRKYRLEVVDQAKVAELTSLFKVLTLLDDVPAEYSSNFIPQHKALVEEGRRLRARLPAYIDQLNASLLTHCPLPSVLQCLVAAYAEPTREDIWSSLLL